MLLPGDIIVGRNGDGAWSSAGLASRIALNLTGMQPEKGMQAKWKDWGNASPNEWGAFSYFNPLCPVKLQKKKDFQEQVKELCWP